MNCPAVAVWVLENENDTVPAEALVTVALALIAGVLEVRVRITKLTVAPVRLSAAPVASVSV